MVFKINEDVGTTKRSKMTPQRALKIWERDKGVCCLCQQAIDGARDDWFIEHKLALEGGGPDVESNMAPAHYACKPEKDAADHSAVAKAKRNKRRHLGIKTSRNPMPGGKDKPYKITFDRRTVDRVTGEPWKGPL